jgi:hypothetical protein
MTLRRHIMQFFASYDICQSEKHFQQTLHGTLKHILYSVPTFRTGQDTGWAPEPVSTFWRTDLLSQPEFEARFFQPVA